MSASTDLVTVYRSMDASAKADCEIIVDLLTAQGLAAVMVDDSAKGVPEGTFEVRVPAPDAARAETLIAENPLPGDAQRVDESESLDLETVFRAQDNMAGFEALDIKNLLESNGVAAVMVGDAVLPNLGFEVRVAREHAAAARELIAEAQAAGPEAAEEAELETEDGGQETRHRG